jgi:hypothetical protein
MNIMMKAHGSRICLPYNKCEQTFAFPAVVW